MCIRDRVFALPETANAVAAPNSNVKKLRWLDVYKRQGKELDTKKGLNWYDYGARMYDAALGRWHVVDPLAEKYYSVSPYNYCMNNPVNAIDSNGEKIVFVNGFLGFGSPTGGSAYWGGTNSSFVRGAQAFLQDKMCIRDSLQWRNGTRLCREWNHR